MSDNFNKKREDVDKTDKFVITDSAGNVQKVIFPHTLKVGLLNNDTYSATISGSIHHTHEGKSFLVAGNNITIVSASNGQITVAASATEAAGDITAVTAGNGLTDGGTTGAVTLNVGAGTGITVNSDDVAFDADGGTLTTSNSDVDQVLINDGGVFKRIAPSNINISSLNNDSGFTANVGDITQVIAGVGLSGGGIVGAVTLNLDFSELTDMTGDIAGTTEFILQNGITESRKAASEIKLSNFNNDAGFTTTSGTVTEVTVGTGLDVSSGTTTPNITLDLSELTDMTSAVVGTQDELILLDNGSERRKLISEITLSDFDNDSGFVTENTMGSGFVLEDGDGTEVTITENKEVKFVEGSGIEINWTDTSSGTDADPYDLTFTVDVSDFMSNGLNNRVITATGTDAMNAEENLLFDGTILAVKDNSGNFSFVTSNDLDAARLPNIISWNTDNSVSLGDTGIGTDIRTLIGVPGTNGGIGGGTKNVTVTGGDLVVSGTLKIQANSSAAEYTFPTSDGSANQFLKTDGNGSLSFATVSGGSGTASSYLAFNAGSIVSSNTFTEMLAGSVRNGQGYKMPVAGEVTHLSVQFTVSAFSSVDSVLVRLFKNGSYTGKSIFSSNTDGTGDFSGSSAITAEAYNAGDTLSLHIAQKNASMTSTSHIALIRIVEDVN